MGRSYRHFLSGAAAEAFQDGYETGNRNTNDVWTCSSNVWSHWALSGSGRAYETDGYYVVPGSVRGAVDRPAVVRSLIVPRVKNGFLAAIGSSAPSTCSRRTAERYGPAEQLDGSRNSFIALRWFLWPEYRFSACLSHSGGVPGFLFRRSRLTGTANI